MNSKAVLEVEGLSKEFDVKRKRFFDKQEKLRAVQDVSLTVLEGRPLELWESLGVENLLLDD